MEYKKNDKSYLFLVTNRHVVEGANVCKLFFTLANEANKPILGARHDLTITNFDKMWHYHPDKEDIAVAQFVPILDFIKKQNYKVYYRSIPLTLIPTDKQLQSLTAMEDIIFIGYPNAIYDKKNLLPIIRKGTTATPIFVDYDGKPCFLIDASVFGGSSGSPCFIYNHGSYTTAEGGMVIGFRMYFVGVVSAVFTQSKEGIIGITEIPTIAKPVVITELAINLGIVIKPAKILETIEYFLSKNKSK